MKLKKFRGSFRFDSCGQRGVATLVVSVGVALLMAVAAVGMMRSGMLEQKIAANDLRVREAQEIAEAGMEYAIASGLAPSNQCPSDLNLIDNKFNFTSNENILNQIIAVQTTGEPYRPSIRWCFKELSVGKIYFVRSQAEIPSLEVDRDPVVKAFVEGWFKKRESYFKDGIDAPAPFLVNGNFCKIIKNGKNDCSKGNKNLIEPPAYQDSNYGFWVTASGEAEIDFLVKDNVNLPAKPLIADEKKNIISAWGAVFDVSIEEAKALAISNPGQPFYYFGDEMVSSNDLKKGRSNADPIVLIFDRDVGVKCPKVNGASVIYGVIYFRDSKNRCKEAGLGNLELHGSIVSDGNIDGINGDPFFYKFDNNTWGALKGWKSEAFIIPGTWRDFEPQL